MDFFNIYNEIQGSDQTGTDKQEKPLQNQTEVVRHLVLAIHHWAKQEEYYYNYDRSLQYQNKALEIASKRLQPEDPVIPLLKHSTAAL